jgi:hypothetical protein
MVFRTVSAIPALLIFFGAPGGRLRRSTIRLFRPIRHLRLILHRSIILGRVIVRPSSMTMTTMT